MFNLGFSELLILAVIALVFIGPKELPEIARVIGRMLNELKRATGDLSSTILAPKEHLQRELEKTMAELEKPFDPNHEGDRLDPVPEPEKSEEKKV